MVAAGRWMECRGDLLAEGAKSLQLRLRERFRVAAVDYHRRRNSRITSGGYLSSTVQRWLDRFSEFRRHSLPSSSVFYRKRVSKDIDAEDESVLTRMLQAVAVPVLGNVCHVFMHGLNRVQIFGAEKLQQVVLHRPENKSLITVSNHVASMDDPLVIASLLPPSMLFDANGLRWTLCASDRCFKNPVTSAFFKYVKVLPVSRGDGIYQKGMDLAISKLNRGGWVHIFPEGSRSRDGGKTMGPAKRGIGRLILDADNTPVVVPFVHTGMQEVMPVGAKFPRVGKTVTVLVGDPISFDDLISEEVDKNMPRGKLYDAVATRIGDRLQKMKLLVETLAIEEALQLEKYPSRVTERATRLLQKVDWESLGMGSYMGLESLDDNPPKQDSLPEPNVAQLYPREERCCYSVGGGLVSRIRGYMDSTELTVFGARGLYTNHRTNQYFGSLPDVSPLKKMSDEEETASQLTDEQKIEIAKWFLLNSPTGEIQYVAKDIRAVLQDERLYTTAAADAFPLYNKAHMICLEFPDRSGEVMVTPFCEIDKNEYLDPRTAQVAIVDHVKQVCEYARPANDEELPSPYIEEYRYALDVEMIKYVSEVYPKGICSVYCVNGKDVEEPGMDFELAVVISAARLSPQNFCNGSWRSIWNVEFKDELQLVEVRGKLQVGAHYFEEGNVQLEAKHECKDSTMFMSPEDCAHSVITIIRHHETEYLNSLQTSYSNLPDATFKDLRRKLPVTRTLFPWHSTLQFSLNRDMQKSLGLEKSK
ncbi:Phospholipid/glycerol acyltransferase family protein [Perilla frutescens var. frutescens]|nr:Phospholipid/glycerol acyltransferase family protein [Perilla frutescens var. frutescens]